MKRQFIIFLTASLMIAGLGLTYSSKVVADLAVFNPITVNGPENRIVLGPKNAASLGAVSQEKYLLEAHRVVTQRLDQIQPAEYYELGIVDDRLVLTLSKAENISYVINIITRVGEVEFVDGGIEAPPLGQEIETGTETISNDNVYQLLFTGHEIDEVVRPNTSSGHIFYQIMPQSSAAQRLSRFVDTHGNSYICLVIDKQVVNCSKIYYWSGDTLEILPKLSGGTGLSLAELAIFLESGPLPFSLEVITN